MELTFLIELQLIAIVGLILTELTLIFAILKLKLALEPVSKEILKYLSNLASITEKLNIEHNQNNKPKTKFFKFF